MTFFNYTVPPLQRKQPCLDVHEIEGLWRVNFRIGNTTLFSSFYTRVDQACILWSVILATIFVTAQFFPFSWKLQAILWSVLTLIGTAVMVAWTEFWVKVERIRWVLYCWVILMLVGLVVTDCGILLGWGEILIRLCPLWLGLSALGYLLTGLGVRSRAIILVGLIHLLSILLLSYFGAWQFLLTGAVMACNLLLLAEWRWDMRSPQ
ncbi:MAG TPA: hypothetical protein DCZ55_15845 [Cyanobacteria bacterium UBA11371]|nr:hypothetical protein [Cyanobacteria bacterium UBA11371]HBE33713.1 hypothetical protein [Cyanobacteria bacterium UBA11368]